MQLETLTIVGVGLIGGSIGLAARRRGAARHILGVGWRAETLETARRLGAIDQGFLALAPAVSNADLVVFCTPVQIIAGQVLEAAHSCRPGALLTDAGSTKAALVAAIEAGLPGNVRFVGSHPLAGSEKRGPEHADPNLFQDRLTIVTPTSRTSPEALERTSTFWQALGSKVKQMTPADHDAALAFTSHLPHLLAAALAGALPDRLRELTATGYRDTTRIAAGDPTLWTGIFLQNREAVLAALDQLSSQLDSLRSVLAAGDERILHQLLEQAKRVRDALGS
jgi:prephenate dehydrogenase